MTADRPVGEPVDGWKPPPLPDGVTLAGRYARLETLDADRHAALLFRAFDQHDWVWDYMPMGPFASAAQFHRWIREITARNDLLFYAIYDNDSAAYGGFAAFLRMKPETGSIEVGYIALSPTLQKTRAATDAIYLMMDWAFRAGYRRLEWKCDVLNAGSRRAAQRFGFSFEGVFVQATLVKGRNRDTAWFAVIDKDWPALSQAFEFWLAESNFTCDRQQKEALGDLTRFVRRADDPDLAGVR
ncbi:GNAT family N-acetyltransferase [Roseovarius aestuariivivens]|uniref:GNAT family N-acetyltransferase n=1 Tax=Roseovarius aestuariivivens TaxID=1888910 RepID=UPI001080F288|nr:GNAT family protein [Roseovarius aestuariivivens]